MKYLTLFILVLCFNYSFGQDYFQSRNEIKISYLRNLIGSYSDTSYYYFKDSIDNLSVTKTGSDKMEAIYYFKQDSIYGDDLCDSISINYYSKKLATQHLDIILNQRNNKWIEVEKNYYISKNKIGGLIEFGKDGNGTYYTCGTLKINSSKEKDVFLTLNFNLVEFERKEWKKLVKQ